MVKSFCEQKVGKPRTNCNRRYSNCFRLRKLSLKTYQKSQKVPLICIVEATERNHRPGPRGPKMPVRNGVKFGNVSMLESFGTFNKFIYSLILNDWQREGSVAISSVSNHKTTGLETQFTNLVRMHK